LADDTTAPGQLELVRQFVNTNDVEDGVDDFAGPEALSAWLSEHGLAGDHIDADDVQRVVSAREALRALMLHNNGLPLDPDAAEALNRAAPTGSLAVRFGPDCEPSLEPHGNDADRALAAIYAAVFRSMAEGTWPRLKACRADTCQWAFYDTSKNRSGTWCSMKVCGNRHKVRSYRERKKS
jgi:predicted RNA-binding Zn ribbon-like protein